MRRCVWVDFVCAVRSERKALEHGRRALRQVLERGFRHGDNQESGRQGRERSVSFGFADAIQKGESVLDRARREVFLGEALS